MKETDIYTYYAFGYNYGLLGDGFEGKAIRGGKDSLETALNDFFQKLEELDLRVTLQAATDLKAIAKRIKSASSSGTVTDKLATEVSDAVDGLDKTLDSELQLRKSYIVTPKRFDIDYLLDSPAKLLGEPASKVLPSIVAFDFFSGCRCIAFALPTSAAFHLMRATEGMLRNYYCSIVQRKRVSPLLWGSMTSHLRSRRNGPPKAILDHLDNIRTNFRNPTQHPEARYDLEEAQDLLAVAIDVINRMAREMRNI